MNPTDIDPAWYWAALAIGLAIAELLVPGAFLVWISAAAAATALLAFVAGPPLVVQFILFAVFAIAAVLGGRRYYLAHPVGSEDPFINERAFRLIGEDVRVTTPFADGRGRVRVGDGEWSARGPDCPSGTIVRIIGMEGATLIVRPAALLDQPSG